MKQALMTMMLMSGLALAQESTTSPWNERDHLSGNWFGLRDRLADDGVTAFAYYNVIFARNVSGGIEQKDDFAGDAYFGLQVDLDKTFGWKDTVFNLSGINRHGDSIDDAVGGQYSVMQLVGGQTTFLYGMNVEKTWDDAIALKLGRTTATDDFVGSPLYGYSLNNAVNGQIRAVLFDGVMTSYPFPVWGGRAKYEPSEEHTFQLGVYQLTKNMWDPDEHGVDFSIRSDDGVSVFTQYDWKPEVNGRPARFYLGMNNVFYDDMVTLDNRDENYFIRFYGHGDVEIVDKLTVFLTCAYTHQDEVAIIPFQSSFGLHYRGLMPGRENDRTVFFVTYGEFSDDLVVAEGETRKDYEMVFELGHRIQATPSLYVQPDIQYIHQPGGTGDISDAIVVGVQAGATF